MRNVILDGAVCAERAAALAALEAKLKLPEWWGRNLDALYDCLWECGEVLLVVKNQQALLDTPFGRSLWQVLADMAEENSRFQVAVARKVRLRGRCASQGAQSPRVPLRPPGGTGGKSNERVQIFSARRGGEAGHRARKVHEPRRVVPPPKK